MSIKISGNKIKNCGTGIRVDDKTGKLDIIIDNNEMEDNKTDISLLITHESRVDLINNKLKGASYDSIHIEIYEDIEKELDRFSNEELSDVERTMVREQFQLLSNNSDDKKIKGILIKLSAGIANNAVAGILTEVFLKFIGL